jgi:hypothetical protein
MVDEPFSTIRKNTGRETSCGALEYVRHCEERSDEAIQHSRWLDWIASLRSQ